jgi:hypothetical protein
LPSPGVWFIQITANLILGTATFGAATIANIRLSDVSGDSTEADSGFSGTGYFIGTTGTLSYNINMSGTYHNLTGGTKILYLNGITTTPVAGTPSTVSGNYKFTRMN